MRIEAERVRLTFHELTKSSCIVCGGPPVASIDLAGTGSPGVRVCAECSARERAARETGAWTARAALLAVLAIGAVVATFDPHPRIHGTVAAWIVSTLIGFIAIRRVRDRRLAIEPFVVLAIDDHRASFEVRRLRVTVGEAAYRSADSSRSEPRPERALAGRRSIGWFVIPAVAGGVLAGVAWRGANPVVMIHNPDSAPHSARIDGGEIVMSPESYRWFRVHFGEHRVAIDGRADAALPLEWNADHVLDVTGIGCYVDEVRTSHGSVDFRGATSSSWRESRAIYRGQWIRVHDAHRAFAVRCRD